MCCWGPDILIEATSNLGLEARDEESDRPRLLDGATVCASELLVVTIRVLRTISDCNVSVLSIPIASSTCRNSEGQERAGP